MNSNFKLGLILEPKSVLLKNNQTCQNQLYISVIHFGFKFGGANINSRGVELILTYLDFSSRIDSNLKIEFAASDSTIDF